MTVRNIIRWLATAALLVVVYSETGWATTLVLTLITIQIELEAWHDRVSA